MNKTAVAVFWGVVLVAAAVIAWFQWPRQSEPPAGAPTVAQAPAAPDASEPAPEAEPEPPEVLYPIESASAPPVQPPFSMDLKASLPQLLGREAVLAYLQTDDFARRFVATVDNLAREQAPPSAWPVNPTPGRFSVAGSGKTPRIAPANAKRYDAFVQWIARLDAGRSVNWYVSAYPQLEQAYVALGYPRGQFNARVVEVIDTLLATPEPKEPLTVQLTEVRGPVKPTRPWVGYEFTDPGLEALTSGQKMLLRMGPEHARVLKARLREIRSMIAG